MSKKEDEIREEKLLSWTAPEYVKNERSWIFVVLSIVIAVGVLVYSIFTKDWFIIPIDIITLFFVLFYRQNDPKEVKYEITQLGLYIDGKLYSYNEIHSYWLVLTNNHKILNIIFKKKYLPQLSIILYGVDPVDLRVKLSQFVPEQEERTESFLEKIARKMNF